MTYIETIFWRIAKWIIKRGYGANCEGSDLDDFPELHKDPKSVFDSGRCASCRAKEIINWIDDHIELINHP